MCHACVIDTVKASGLSRREFFRASAVSAAALGAAAAAPAALAGGHRKVVDLTHVTSPAFPTYFGQPMITVEQINSHAENGFNSARVEHFEHVGTHVDAPIHFSADGESLHEIPVGNLVAALCVIDIREKAAADPDAQVTPDDLRAWISANGEIPSGACVAMNSGWSDRATGDAFRNPDADGVMHFPGFHADAAQMLIEQTGAVAMAVDTLSLDHGPSQDFATHNLWLPTNRLGVECVANLDDVPVAGATIVIGTPRIENGSGGPARVMALV